MDNFNPSKVTWKTYVVFGLVALIAVVLFYICGKAERLPADTAFYFMTETTDKDVNFYKTAARIRIEGQELTIGYMGYEIGDSISQKVIHEVYRIKKRGKDVVEMTDQEGRLHRVEFFRDASEVVVGARLTGDGTMVEYHLAQ